MSPLREQAELAPECPVDKPVGLELVVDLRLVRGLVEERAGDAVERSRVPALGLVDLLDAENDRVVSVNPLVGLRVRLLVLVLVVVDRHELEGPLRLGVSRGRCGLRGGLRRGLLLLGSRNRSGVRAPRVSEAPQALVATVTDTEPQ